MRRALYILADCARGLLSVLEKFDALVVESHSGFECVLLDLIQSYRKILILGPNVLEYC